MLCCSKSVFLDLWDFFFIKTKKKIKNSSSESLITSRHLNTFTPNWKKKINKIILIKKKTLIRNTNKWKFFLSRQLHKKTGKNIEMRFDFILLFFKQFFFLVLIKEETFSITWHFNRNLIILFFPIFTRTNYQANQLFIFFESDNERL